MGQALFGSVLSSSGNGWSQETLDARNPLLGSSGEREPGLIILCARTGHLLGAALLGIGLFRESVRS